MAHSLCFEQIEARSSFIRGAPAAAETNRCCCRTRTIRAAGIQSSNVGRHGLVSRRKKHPVLRPGPSSGTDLWLLPLTGDKKPVKFLASPADEMHGNFSPDGHLVAYTSNESGKFQVNVQTLPLIRQEVAGFHRRRLRAALARRWTRDLLPFRRPQADGGRGRAGTVLRYSQGPLPDASAARCHRQPHCIMCRAATASDSLSTL